MRICFVDDSVAYDGRTPQAGPLGGGEKAVVGLAAALAERGHEVTVFNRCAAPAVVDGVSWLPLDATPPEITDIVIAVRRPRLLQHVPMAFRRILWVMADPAYLEKPAVEDLLERFDVRLLFLGRTQAAAYRGKRPGLTVPPGVAAPFLAPPRKPEEPPVAVVTTHPDHGLGWMLDLWVDEIHPLVPDARLHVYSALLARAVRGAAVSEAVHLLHDRIVIAEDKGVAIRDPLSDGGMAAAYASARCHLYPGHREDLACWTLAESQSCGLPAVARPRGVVHERVVNGESGYIVPDDAAFANVTAQLMTRDGMARGLSEGAAAPARRRPWALAAAEVEALWTVDGVAGDSTDGSRSGDMGEGSG